MARSIGITAGLSAIARETRLRGDSVRVSGVYDSARLSKVIYWLAVLAVSLALVIALVLLFESLDDSAVEGARLVGVP